MNTNSQPHHDQLIYQLPWHVNGTLDELGSVEIRGHLEHCPSCQKEVESLTHLQRALSESPGKVPDAQQSYQRLQQRLKVNRNIDKQELDWFRQLIASTKRFYSTSFNSTWALGAMAALLVAVTVVPQMTWNTNAEEDAYRVLGDSLPTSGVTVRVMFDSKIDVTEAEATLDDMVRSAVLPVQWFRSEINGYQILVAGTGDEQTPSPDELQNWMDHLRSHPQITAIEVVP